MIEDINNQRTIGDPKMGRFRVAVDLANNADIIRAQDGHLDPKDVRRVTVEGVVDSGAARFVLPLSVAEALGLQSTSKVKVLYADHRTETRDQVEGVHLELLGRDGVFKAVVEPKRQTALIGAIVLEDLDLLVDCTNQRLVPRDPRYVISEIE
jgi:predicted aspartyl protease